MKPRSGLVLVGLLSLGLLNYSCANGDTISGSSGNGGSSSNGGSGSGTGGTTHTGGTTGTGGTHTGGTTGTGGIAPGTGGTHTGGTTGTGGTHTGGTTGTGGIASTGGITGTGGTPTGTGGTTGTTTCGTSFAITSAGFVTMPAKGGACWSGYGYTYGDTYGTTFMPADFSTCGEPCKLTETGNIKAVTGTMYSFIGLGFNLGDSSSGGTAHPTVTPTGTGLTFTFADTAPAGTAFRAQITDGTTTWCYTVAGASPVSVPYGSFNTMCYDSPPDGTAYAKQPINAIQLQVAGGTAGGATSITITSVTEN
jgi:hypothetical protein